MFGYLSTNVLHAAIHLLVGVIGLVAGIRQTARGYCTIVGLALILTGILYFLPYTGQHMGGLFNMNTSQGNLNLFLGVIAVLVALSGGPSPKPKA